MPVKSPEPVRLAAADRIACQKAIRTGSKSFHAASLLLPQRVREPARALYAFCRSTDDLVDAGACSGRATDLLMQRLDAIYRGAPQDHLCDRAFARVVTAHRIPRNLPDALIEGFAWDEEGRVYRSLDALAAYAARVASTVGLMMTLIMGVRDRSVLARAADLGIAMQYTNIARDVGEDARNGRVYLPRDWLAEEGLSAAMLVRDPRPSPALSRVVARLLAAADAHYARAGAGIGGLPLDCRPAIRSAGLIYRDIGRAIAENGHDSVTRRAVTSRAAKVRLLLFAAATPFPAATGRSAPPHESVAHLVEACSAPETVAAPRGFDEKFGRVLDLLATTERRERALMAATRGRG
ncbi:phytoene/squalene synthase family protein [Stappia stellulata]|uniref:phytoene/squalene synthase family protein n=1 Tax=Stappia stellulata TaxID=71235 RepID=UPI00042A6DD0|nr:phytoene/squalene synthase family protein [Stappia stellulata]